MRDEGDTLGDICQDGPTSATLFLELIPECPTPPAPSPATNQTGLGLQISSIPWRLLDIKMWRKFGIILSLRADGPGFKSGHCHSQLIRQITLPSLRSTFSHLHNGCHSIYLTAMMGRFLYQLWCHGMYFGSKPVCTLGLCKSHFCSACWLPPKFCQESCRAGGERAHLLLSEGFMSEGRPGRLLGEVTSELGLEGWRGVCGGAIASWQYLFRWQQLVLHTAQLKPVCSFAIQN